MARAWCWTDTAPPNVRVSKERFPCPQSQSKWKRAKVLVVRKVEEAEVLKVGAVLQTRWVEGRVEGEIQLEGEEMSR